MLHVSYTTMASAELANRMTKMGEKLLVSLCESTGTKRQAKLAKRELLRRGFRWYQLETNGVKSTRAMLPEIADKVKASLPSSGMFAVRMSGPFMSHNQALQ